MPRILLVGAAAARTEAQQVQHDHGHAGVLGQHPFEVSAARIDSHGTSGPATAAHLQTRHYDLTGGSARTSLRAMNVGTAALAALLLTCPGRPESAPTQDPMPGSGLTLAARHLAEAAGLGQALRAAGSADVAVHQVTHHCRLPDPALFFRRLPDWTPPLRPLSASLPAEAIGRAAAAFGDVVTEHSTSEGMPQLALIGVGTRF